MAANGVAPPGPLPADTGRQRAWPPTLVTFAAVAAVLAWFAVQFGRFVSEAPDLDAMISLRESIVFHREGLDGLIAHRAGGGVHPPVLDVLSSLSFAVLGEDPASLQILAIPLFAVLAIAVERLLSAWLPARQRVAATFAVAICPALAIVLALVAREALILAVLAVALAIVLAPSNGMRRLILLSAVLALLPLIKDAGLVLVLPFAVFAAVTGRARWRERLERAGIVISFPVVAALIWRAVLAAAGGHSWNSWVDSPAEDHGPYVVALRAMFGLEDVTYLRQNLANAFIVNWLWLPTMLAVVTLVLLFRGGSPGTLRNTVLLLVGLEAVWIWTTLSFPTFAIPRYATPVIFCTILVAVLGVSLWPRRAQPLVLGALIVAFALGAWSPTDPVTRAIWGTTSVGGEQIYDTPERERGPDRMVINLAVLRASARINERLRHVFASDVTMVTGDCDAMKFGEKLFSVGLHASAYDRRLPEARPLRCVSVVELPAGAANGDDKIGLVRTVEEDAAGQPPAVTGPAIVVLR